jgi:hypothetical protein
MGCPPVVHMLVSKSMDCNIIHNILYIDLISRIIFWDLLILTSLQKSYVARVKISECIVVIDSISKEIAGDID